MSLCRTLSEPQRKAQAMREASAVRWEFERQVSAVLFIIGTHINRGGQRTLYAPRRKYPEVR